MEDHEYLAPHPVAVYHRVQLLARIYRRRRFLAQSAGGVVLGAGMLAGLIQMHSFIQGEVATQPPFAGEPSPPPPSPTPNDPTPPKSSAPPNPTDAFLEAGYDWDDAVRLARLWNLDDPAEAKSRAGRRLLSGKPVPIRPG